MFTPVSQAVRVHHARADRVEVTYVRGGHVDAHALVRHVVSRWTGVDPDEVGIGHVCPHCGSSEHGRLVLLAGGVASVSLSRTVGLVAVAVTDRPAVGVDVELVSPQRFDGVDEVACHDLESPAGLVELARLWVRKESVLKACGLGLEVPLSALSLTEGAGGPVLDAWPGGARLRPEVAVVDLAVGETHVGALAVAGGPVDLVVTEVDPVEVPAVSPPGGREARAPRARRRREPPPARGRLPARRPPARSRPW